MPFAFVKLNIELWFGVLFFFSDLTCFQKPATLPQHTRTVYSCVVAQHSCVPTACICCSLLHSCLPFIKLRIVSCQLQFFKSTWNSGFLSFETHISNHVFHSSCSSCFSLSRASLCLSVPPLLFLVLE